MKKNNKFINNKFIRNTSIILPIVLLSLYYFYGRYSKSKRIKMNVKERMRVLTELYTMVVDIALENDVKPFLLFGTLLGQQRNNKLICYDYDVDMGILSTDFDKLYAGLKKKIDPTKYTIRLINNFIISKSIQIKDKKTALNIDIDLYVKQSNGSFKRYLSYFWFTFTKYKNNQCNKRDIPHDWLLPLRPVSFLGKNVYIPNNPKAFLECDYGKDYLTPNHKCDEACMNCVKI
jgi:phosphorylcholine metabolism protein LicD